ncbi:hypothetical protein [Pseudomonas xanthosomatis]|uniref:hypothetical protein n=1 Tax=Pseudomonas xanthosomatis TaxID=2842356 RepID=UPI003515E53F
MTALCAGCEQRSRQPAAQLTFLGLSKNHGKHFVSFSTPTNLFNIYELENPASQSSPALVCSFNGDMNFSYDHEIQARSEGFVVPTSQPTVYRSNLLFSFTSPNGQPAELNSFEYFTPLLMARPNIACKVIVTSWGFKPYFSQTLNIPSTLMLELLNQADH